MPPQAAAAAAHAAARAALDHDLFGGCGHVGVYVGSDGEIDPEPLAVALRARGVETYYPVTGDSPEGVALTFRSWDGAYPMVRGHFDIPVPPPGSGELGAAELDAVVVPLVAFDTAGNRLGRGAGYYDRALGAARSTTAAPLLVGWAYDFQQVERIDPEPWDVRLDLVVTPTRLVWA